MRFLVLTAAALGIGLGVLGVLVPAPRLTGAESEPWWAYPHSTTTGVAGVDAAIRAMGARDANDLQSQFLFTSRPCAGTGGIPCLGGQPVGTQVDVFSAGQCEAAPVVGGDAAIAGTLAAMTGGQHYLYAVGSLHEEWLPSTYALFFGGAGDPGVRSQFQPSSPADQPVVIFTDHQGDPRSEHGCGSGVADRVQDVAPIGFLLLPRNVVASSSGGGKGRAPWVPISRMVWLITFAVLALTATFYAAIDGRLRRDEALKRALEGTAVRGKAGASARRGGRPAV